MDVSIEGRLFGEKRKKSMKKKKPPWVFSICGLNSYRAKKFNIKVNLPRRLQVSLHTCQLSSKQEITGHNGQM